MTERTRFAIYARCATQQERGPSFALTTQIHDCKEHGIKQGYDLAENLIYEEVCNGNDSNRPGLTALREAAQCGEYDVLLVNSFDRISRKQTELAVILNGLETYGVRVESVQEPFDGTAMGKFLLYAQEFAAQTQREMITARMQLGKQAKRLAVSPDEASVVRHLSTQASEE